MKVVRHICEVSLSMIIILDMKNMFCTKFLGVFVSVSIPNFTFIAKIVCYHTAIKQKSKFRVYVVTILLF
jgi:hypothetical protein